MTGLIGELTVRTGAGICSSCSLRQGNSLRRGKMGGSGERNISEGNASEDGAVRKNFLIVGYVGDF
jgi:hypothetical protein